MRTFRAGLESLIVAARATDQIALGPREDVDNQPDDAGKHDQYHPDHGTVHPARFRVTRYPDQQRDVEDDDADGDEYQ
jgi:hypothetical protein